VTDEKELPDVKPPHVPDKPVLIFGAEIPGHP
jgi:hypothetical protein